MGIETAGRLQEVPLWTRSYTLAVLTNFFIGIPFALFLPVLPVYVLEELRGSPAAAGAVNAVFMLAIVLFRAQTDRLEQRFGKRQVLLSSVLLFACSHLGYLAASTIPAIMLLRFCSGAFFAIANTSIMALGAEFIPLKRKGEGFAYITTAVSVGTALGPFIGLMLARAYGFTWVFIFSWMIALCGSLLILSIPITKKVRVTEGVRPFVLRELFEVRAVPAASLIMLIMIASSAVLSFVSVYAKSLQLPVVAGNFFVVLALCSIGSRLLTSRVADRFGVGYALYPGIAAQALGLFLLGRGGTSPAMFLAAALIGYGYGVVVPALQLMALHHSPPHRTGVVTATFFTFLDFGLGAGAYLAGACIPLVGYATMYLLLSPLVLTVALLYFLFDRYLGSHGFRSGPAS